MPIRKAIKGVLHSFLSSFTSRYSDYDGYWVFGLITDGLDGLTINLLNAETGSAENKVVASMAQLAQRKLREQMDRENLPMSFVHQARMLVTKSELPVRGFVGGRMCSGYNYNLSVEVITDLKRPFRARCQVFVAPHDPVIEHRSTRRL